MFKLCALIGLACALTALQLSSAHVGKTTFLIKGHQLESLMEVLVQARRFLSNRLSDDQRCTRIAVVLSSFNGQQMNQFEVADIATARKEDIDRKFNQINVERLRDLYIKTARQYLKSGYVDASLVDLLRCLKTGFHNVDAKARSFLNNEQLNTIINQFEAIKKQPVKLLIDGDARESGLDLRNFHETMKRMIRSWVGEDEEKVKRLFSNPSKEEIPIENKMDEEKTHQQKAEAEAGPEAEPEAGPEAGTEAQNQDESIEPSDLMGPQEKAYLEAVLGSLAGAYESFPLDAKLAARCSVYSRLIEATNEELQELSIKDYVEHAVANISNQTAQQGPSRDTFKPDKKIRDDFLFLLEILDPLKRQAEIWFDLDDCVSKWADEDEDVVRYMNSSRRAFILNTLQPELDSNDGLTEGAAGSAAH